MSDDASNLLLWELAGWLGNLPLPTLLHATYTLLQAVCVQEYVPDLNKVCQYFFLKRLVGLSFK